MSPIVKRKGEKFTLPSKYLLFILTILCAGTMVLTYSTNIFNKPLNTFVGYTVIPFQKGISCVGSWLSHRSDELKQIRDLLNENANLKAQIDELTIQNTLLQQERYELNTLRDLYELDNQYDEYPKVGARIIGRDAGNWYHTFTVDKGTNDGILVDMNVLADGGLVGRVSAVGPNWAQVTSIIADNSNVGAMTLATGDNMIVSGRLDLMEKNVVSFEKLIDSKNKVTTGDKVVTSNISDKYLPNILIGYIHTVEQDSNKLTKSGYLTPAVDFEHLHEVLIITQLKQTKGTE